MANKCNYIEQEEYDGDISYKCDNCNEIFIFPDGGPKENEFYYCPKCGYEIEEVLTLIEDEED